VNRSFRGSVDGVPFRRSVLVVLIHQTVAAQAVIHHPRNNVSGTSICIIIESHLQIRVIIVLSGATIALNDSVYI
jgi:hypothetical protein